MGGGFQPHKRATRVMAPGRSGQAMRRGSATGKPHGSLAGMLAGKQRPRKRKHHGGLRGLLRGV